MPTPAVFLIYQLKVTLTGVKPQVWRRLLVPSTLSLEKLHQILQVALGWTDSHLHEFAAHGLTYGMPHSEYENATRDEADVLLSEVLVKEKESLIYEYDFGDGWEHIVLLEKVLSTTPDMNVPICIAGARACPPEDCGGPGGYEELLAAIRDPAHQEHATLLEWIGDDFDPDHFDQTRINDELARINER
jgi:hypothetical protein